MRISIVAIAVAFNAQLPLKIVANFALNLPHFACLMLRAGIITCCGAMN